MRLSASSCMRSALFGVYCFDASYPRPKQGQRQAPPSITDCRLAMSMTSLLSLSGCAWRGRDTCAICIRIWRASSERERDGVCRFEKEYSVFVFACRIYCRLSHSTRGRRRPRCSRPEALNGSRLYPQWAYWPSSALQGISHSKFIAWLFKSFIFHYWFDESIDDFFQRRSQSPTLTRTDINNLCKLMNSQTHTHTHALMHLYWLHSLLSLVVVVAATNFHFRKRWQAEGEEE